MPIASVEQLCQLPYPQFQPLAGSEIGSFAHGTISKRLPSIVENIISDVRSYAAKHQLQDGIEDVVKGLQQMQQDMAKNAEVTAVPAPDSSDAVFAGIVAWTNNCLQAYQKVKQQTSWWDLPWLIVECYMYVRIAHLLRSCPALGRSFDPFADQKLKAFQKSAAPAAEVAAATRQLLEACNCSPERDALFEVMQYSLWGNKTDLSMLVDASNVDPTRLSLSPSASTSTPYLIVDHFPAVWSLLAAPPSPDTPRRIDIILDNTGLELLGDLCLADYLTASGLADEVVFHGKELPWFVSDTMQVDFDIMLDLCCDSEDASLQWLAGRWKRYVVAKKWRYTTHPFWTSPFPFCWMQQISPDLHEQLAGSSLLVFKGDLNYRKLSYDCRWPLTTSFEEALMGFGPAPMVSLRTLKADVMAGLLPGQGQALSAADPDWMVNGKYGIVQASL